MDNNSTEYTREFLIRKTNSIYNRIVKRVVDLTLAIIFFVLLLPLFLIVSLIVIIDSGFPVFYCAPRGGYKGKSFKIIKFRTMVRNADRIGGYTTAYHDPRITKVGKILRKTKIDEIPQLLNIIKGEMSFVGPRPEIIEYTERFEGLEELILQVRPGITDYSSLKFSNMDETVGDSDVDSFFVNNILKQKNELRVKYVATISFTTDMKLFFLTVFKVLRNI